MSQGAVRVRLSAGFVARRNVPERKTPHARGLRGPQRGLPDLTTTWRSSRLTVPPMARRRLRV